MNRKLSRTTIIIVEIFLCLYAISLIFPYIWLINNSFKSVAEFYQNIWSLPKVLRISNYINALKQTNMLSYFLNSIIITSVGTFTEVIFSAMAAYVLAKYRFKGNSIIYSMTVIGLLIPSVGTLAPLYVFMKKMHLFNMLGLLIIYASGLGTNMLIYYAFFKNLSWSYAEAAFIDGANDWKVFLKVMLPMAKGTTIAVSIITSISIFNDYFLPSILLTNPKRLTVAVGLRALYVQQQYAATWTTLFAAVILATIPTLLLYAIFHDKITKGFLMGGLKE